MKSKNILFITYDGLTDPLGQSQILPYMSGLSKLGYNITILSCDKHEQFVKFAGTIQKLVDAANIEWHSVSFTRKPPILSKVYDFHRLRYLATKIVKSKKIDIVHCRSYVAIDIGLRIKRKFGCKIVFDMRGFWADERKDSGAWDMDSWFYRNLYHTYKQKERKFILNSDYLITLTNAAKTEILSWDFLQNKEINIATIPCCADMEHFSLTSEIQKKLAREHLQIDSGSFVVSYLGSIGAWYLLDEMLSLFKLVLSKYSNAIFLFITHSEPELILSRLLHYGIDHNYVKIVSATRDEVPVFLKASDINLSFIRNVYSKIASSPTKNAEVLATGIPVIFNAGIGDVDDLSATGVGHVMRDFSERELQRAVNSIDNLIQLEPATIRQTVVNSYNLTYAISVYDSVYKKL